MFLRDNQANKRININDSKWLKDIFYLKNRNFIIKQYFQQILYEHLSETLVNDKIFTRVFDKGEERWII